MNDADIIKAKELLKKLEEAYNAYYDTSKSMPYDFDKTIRETAICLENAITEINRQQAEIERFSRAIHNMSTTTEVQTRAENEFQWLQINRVKQARAEAITEFAERLCEGRVSNDPVVIAVKVELEMMKVGVNNA